MRVNVKKVDNNFEYSFEDVTSQEVRELINIFEGGNTPQDKPNVTITQAPVEVLLASGSKLDHLGLQVGLERRILSSETDIDFRLRIAKRYNELGYLK